MKTTAQFFVAAAVLRERLVGKFDPNQRRDSDGQWSDDRLDLGSRIKLGDGEELLGSRQGSVNAASTAVPVLAAVRDDAGTHVRFGVVAADDAEKWAGANRGGTAVLDEAALANLNSTLDAENAKAKARAREIQKIWDDLDDAQADLDDASGEDEDADELAAARDRLERAQAAEAAWFDSHEVDELIAEGVVTGSAWGDIAYRVQGVDDQAGGWEVQLAVRPHDGEGWSFDDVDDPARLDLADWRQMQRQIKALTAGGPSNRFDGSVMAGRGRALARGRGRSSGAEFRVENRAGDTAEIYLYSEIGGWGVTAAQFVQELGQVKAQAVDLHINSPGGDAFDGVAIYNALVASKKRIRVYVDGLAASIASVIAMAGEHVTMGRGSQMMIHDAHGFAVGNVDAMRSYIDLLERTSADIAGFYASRAGGSAEQWRTRMKAETWYSAEEAVKAGLADEVVAAPTLEQVVADWDLSVFNFAGRGRAPAPSVARDVAAAARAGVGDGAPVQQPAEPEPVRGPVVDKACPVHHTDTAEGTWDKSTHEGRLVSPMTVATARAMYGWFDPGRVKDGKIVKDACKLPHHEVSADGSPGAANLNGVRNALARLPQSDIPEAEHDAVRRHLQAHLDDAPDGEQRMVFDPAVFEASLAAALDPMPGFDPEQFRNVMGSIALDAPAAPAPVVKAAAEPEPEPAPEPEPELEPEIGGFRPSLFRAALQLGVTTVPALPDPQPPAPAPADGPVQLIDPASFKRSLWEAKL